MIIERVELQPQPIVGLHEVVPMDALPDFFGRAFHAAADALAEQGLEPSGPPVAVYGSTPTDAVDVTAGLPVDGPVTVGGDLVVRELPGGPVVQAVHIGSYDDLPQAYGEVMKWMGARHLSPVADMWEQYLNDPDSVEGPQALQTRIVIPAGAVIPS